MRILVTVSSSGILFTLSVFNFFSIPAVASVDFGSIDVKPVNSQILLATRDLKKKLHAHASFKLRNLDIYSS